VYNYRYRLLFYPYQYISYLTFIYTDIRVYIIFHLSVHYIHLYRLRTFPLSIPRYSYVVHLHHIILTGYQHPRLDYSADSHIVHISIRDLSASLHSVYLSYLLLSHLFYIVHDYLYIPISSSEIYQRLCIFTYYVHLSSSSCGYIWLFISLYSPIYTLSPLHHYILLTYQRLPQYRPT
jgi:hypothetical protein